MPPRCSCGLIYIWPRGPAWSCRRLCAQTALAMGNVYPSRSVHYRTCSFLIGKYDAFQTHISELLQHAELEGVCRSPAAPLSVDGSQACPRSGRSDHQAANEGRRRPALAQPFISAQHGSHSYANDDRSPPRLSRPLYGYTLIVSS
jgi:hypothetical protein